jgi:hypothetical protein
MTREAAVVDVYLSAARENSAAAMELAEALLAGGVTCFSGASDRSPAETLTALETGRALVFVLSAAANSAPDVIRELERAAGRGIPIITYAIEDVSPSPSIAYFTETIPPIAAWSAEDRQRAIQTLVDAARRALTESATSPRRSGLTRSRYSRATYRDSRNLQRGLAVMLAIAAVLNAYALYRDGSYVAAILLGQQASSASTAEEYFGVLRFASAVGLWTIAGGTILALRRARLNLLSVFANVRTSGSEIVWRPIVPFANAFWMAQMANDLREPSDSGDAGDISSWPLARYWSYAFLCAYSIGGARDAVIGISPQGVSGLVGLSVPLDVSQVVSAVLTYAVLSQLLDRVRIRTHHTPAVSSPSVPAIQSVPAESAAGYADVLVIYAAADEGVAGSVAKALEDLRCRCWTLSPTARATALSAHHLAGFRALLVVVSRASYSSEPITELVRCALAGAVSVLPYVVEPPPTGSALGHYIRSLHWIDGAVSTAGLRSEQVRTAFTATPAAVASGGGTAVLVEDGLFSPLRGTAVHEVRYRPAPALRALATVFAIMQVAAAAFFGIIAFAIALSPENTDPSAPLGLTIGVVAGSLPAWCAFLPWLWVTDRNARSLRIVDLESRTWLLCRVAVPGLSLILGGLAIGRLWRAVRHDEEQAQGWADPVTRFQVTWTAAGFVWIVAAVVSAVLGAGGWIVSAMLVAMVQCVATMARGVLRYRVIRDIASRLDARARPWFEATRPVRTGAAL